MKEGRGLAEWHVCGLMDQKTTEQPAAEAARWYVRLRAEDCTLGEREAFQAWLGQSPAHARAYEHAKAVSRRVSGMSQQDPRLRQLAAAALADVATSPRTTSWRFAAALVLGVGLAALLAVRQFDPGRAAIAHYANSSLQQQLILLPDGSRVHLDVGSRLDVQMTPTGRALALREGRAYFEVAHDASRPFAVLANGVRTVALGTRFQVALAPEHVTVTLAEGSVAVSHQDGSGSRETLRPGEQLRLGNDGADPVRLHVDAAQLLGWSTGRLVFRGTPLADVLDEINRYAPVKLRMGDESLGKVSVGGTFVAGADSAQVANALAAALPLNAVRVGAREIVLFRRYDAAD